MLKKNVFKDVLSKVKDEHKIISVFVKNGYRIPGYVLGVDNDAVVIESVSGDIQMVRIDAISTVSGLDKVCVQPAVS